MLYSIHRNLHTDFSVFEQNKMAARSYFIPFSNTEELRKTDYKNERYKSERVMMLSGEWNFEYFEKLSEVPESYDSENRWFDFADVPCTWQRSGFDQIAYINTRYPFPKRPPHIPEDAPVGIYRKYIRFDNAATHRILTFLGVAGATAVYMNGKYVGYSEGSHNTAEFDITPFAAEGENELLVVVYKWSNGTYLECQDMFRENGIFRDVYIVSHAESYLSDFLFRPKKNFDGTYDLKINVNGRFTEGVTLSVNAEDKDGNILFDIKLLPETETVLKALTVGEWSAEIPNVYKVTMSLANGEEELEAIRTYIGFKDVVIKKEVFTFNGKAIKIKGVNHHDTHMTKGYAMWIADMEKDIRLMKRFNCNAVRTSHYPPDPAFLIMCDIYGLYVVDEADIETHGFYSVPGTYRPGRLSNDLKWASHYLDRVKRMYERDKNHPSITMWSLGNESGGYKCQDVCYDFLKEVNPEIPVHYEGVNRSKRWAYDVVSHMYASPALMRRVLAGKGGKRYEGKPFFQCEYAHAMGNGPGGLEEYMQLFYSSEQFMGGCIWEWADHSVYDENAKYKWTYGGDHNEPIHDGNFCVDGLFFPDREPSSGAYEMREVYRPVRAEYKNGKVEFWNTRSFRDTSDISIKWDVSVDGKAIAAGHIEPVIPAGGRYTFELGSEYLNLKDKDIYVNIEYFNMVTGFITANEQMCVNLAKQPPYTPKADAEISKKGSRIEVAFENGGALFDVKKGLVSYKKHGSEYLLDNPIDGLNGFVPHIFRGVIDNDRNLTVFWNILGLSNAEARFTGCKLKGNKIRTSYIFVTRGVFILAAATVDYTFDADGNMTVTAALKKVAPLTSQLPRFGVHAEMRSAFKNVKYYGRGPLENYSDFKEHAPVGIYATTVDKMGHKYIKPQDSGNRGEVRYGKLFDDDCNALHFTAIGNKLNFNANPFTLNELIKAKHIEDIPNRDVTFAAFDGFVRGTGSGSCGPITSKEHQIPFGYFKPLTFTFTVNAVKEKKYYGFDIP